VNVKAKIELPVHVHREVLLLCPSSSREHEILINGCISQRVLENGQTVEIVEVICDANDAQELFELTRRIHPEAARAIAKSIDLLSRKNR
jgi:hypothetical protein